jgi:alkylation response protein AidB-like acyl-CoA dehydrogenase
MTHPVALIVDRYASQEIKKKFLFESIRSDGETKTGGTWATEKHSGSDIAGTETKAVYQPDGTVRLSGQKWFASNADSGLMIATARPEDAPKGSKGLGLYLVPSHVDDGWRVRNDYEVTYLKEKIGTRALATGEIRLDGCLAYELAPPPEGLRVMMEALGCSRVHNAMAAAGVMRRALSESLCWVTHREAFGKKLIMQPMIRKRILDIAVQWMAGCALAFEAAHCFDKATEGGDDYIWSRIATALAKYKTAEQAVWCAQKALGLVAGNGYTEDYPVARQFRDAMVLPVWEGPEQIQALELMRMIAGREMGDRVFLEKLTGVVAEIAAAGLDTEKTNLELLLRDMRGALEELRGKPEQIESVADEFLHKMSDILAYALLCREAAWELENDNNRAKHLVCGCYFESVLVRQNSPSFARHPLLEHFDAFIAGDPIPA